MSYPQPSGAIDFDALFRSHHREIAQFIAVRVADPERAQDIAAETFLACMQYCRTSDAVIRNPRALLFTIARRCIIRAYEERTKMLREVPMEDAPDVIAPGSLPDATDANAAVAETRRAMDRLRVEYREILILNGVVGMTISEIATVLGKQSGAVRVLLFRARRALRKELGSGTLERT